MDRTVDYVIIAVYLIVIALIGIFSGGKQKSVSDYFLGAKSVPWWAVCFSIVAAETSTLTFISIPGLAYLTNLNFLQLAFGFLIGRIIIAYFFLPSYFKGELSTAYAYLEKRFGIRTRSFASIIFMITRTAADGVRLFATAIPLKLLLGISYPASIFIITVITLIYTITGGVKGIIWVDVIQMFIYLGGAILAGYFLLAHFIPGGWESVIYSADAEPKFEIFNLGFQGGIKEFFSQPYTLLGGIIGGTFLSMASHGTDQLIVQRLLTTKDLNKSQKAIIGSGIIVIIQFTLFLLVGIALYIYYGPLNMKSDEIFPKFIIENLPLGVSGIIIAGLFAAAMSTLAGSISSLSSSTMLDIVKQYSKKLTTNRELFISRIISFMWAGLLAAVALFFIDSSQAVVEMALSIASFTYGGLLGTFILGLVNKKASEKDALTGFISGIIVMILVIFLQVVAWTWFILIGVVTTVIIGSLMSLFIQRKIG